MSRNSSANGPRSPLRLPDVANLIVKLRRTANKSKANKAAAAAQQGFPIECTSGVAQQTHPCLVGEGVISARKVPLIEQRRLFCSGGVDTKRLLRTLRATLLEEAQMMGATVLVDEQYVVFCRFCAGRCLLCLQVVVLYSLSEPSWRI